MKPYAAFPELGGAKQLVCDGDRVVWDIGKVANNAQVQQSINDFDNPRRRFDVVFEWMDLEEFMEIQWRIYAKFSDRYAHYHDHSSRRPMTLVMGGMRPHANRKLY